MSQPDVVATVAQAAELSRPPLLVLEPLERFLDARGIGSGPITPRPIGDGHSNVTYALERGGVRVVLRRPPRPPLPPSAHDVVREARIQIALAGRVRVPRVLAVCEETNVLGVPFYVMEHVDAHVVGPSLPPQVDISSAQRACFGRELVDALAELHDVSLAAAGLEDIGRPDGYLARQIRRFAALWEQHRTRELPEIDQLTSWLGARVPSAGDATIVHGDYRLGNVMFTSGSAGSKGGPRLAAILDWEMATLGDPLADVGYLIATWAEPGDEETPMLALSAATRMPGFSTRAELRERYAQRTGRSVNALGWYETLALWKAAIFLECSYARYQAGTTDDPYFASLGTGVPALAQSALQRMSRC
ncbi:phosphotransferase family protein [Conexibacter sp. CPCC 206217]|uniref:phosphotransferase family protein n=1 Tax=Conexibacter sp. CPCC 206217 TaxID=3064574 RepID=UPI00271BC19C|nr:phosphotransferase family protein [Conexibacter sp. CPCC 206217]MDO8210145.1 phosphotransferase family protein [Conexibacter sp. CPCC 206217]